MQYRQYMYTYRTTVLVSSTLRGPERLESDGRVRWVVVVLGGGGGSIKNPFVERATPRCEGHMILAVRGGDKPWRRWLPTRS